MCSHCIHGEDTAFALRCHCVAETPPFPLRCLTPRAARFFFWTRLSTAKAPRFFYDNKNTAFPHCGAVRSLRSGWRRSQSSSRPAPARRWACPSTRTPTTRGAGTSPVCLFVHTQHSQKAGPFSVAGPEMDLPFHNRLAFTGEVPALFPPPPPTTTPTTPRQLARPAARPSRRSSRRSSWRLMMMINVYLTHRHSAAGAYTGGWCPCGQDISTADFGRLWRLAPQRRPKAQGQDTTEISTSRCRTTRTVLQNDGPDDLELRCNALPAHYMALLTSGCDATTGRRSTRSRSRRCRSSPCLPLLTEILTDVVDNTDLSEKVCSKKSKVHQNSETL